MSDKELVNKIFDKIEEVEQVEEVHSLSWERNLLGGNLIIKVEIEGRD